MNLTVSAGLAFLTHDVCDCIVLGPMSTVVGYLLSNIGQMSVMIHDTVVVLILCSSSVSIPPATAGSKALLCA